MKKSVVILGLLTLLFGCKKNNFHLEGTVKDAAGQTLYLIHDELVSPKVIDSVKLGKDGEFSFSEKRPQYPDFYKLRLGADKFITFAVDSCDQITINSQDKNFSTDYKVEGSPNSLKIQQLRKSLISIQLNLDDVRKETSATERNSKTAKIFQQIENHKNVAKKLIMENPASTVAYFAIYQQIDGSFLFSPYDKEDAAYCKAVATSYNIYMPEYIRTKNLYSLVIDAIQKERSALNNRAWQEVIQKVGKGYIDISLPDKDNVSRKLSDLEGKVVLLDFSAYEANGSVDYTFALRELYNKYHSKGFEIYQVSVDQNKVLWQQSVENLPWICVRDEDGPQAECLRSYNVGSIPTTFVLNRKGDILQRNANLQQLKSLIEKSL